MKLYTSTLKYKGPSKVDVTVKRGSLWMAPSWEMVFDLKRGRIDVVEYTRRYLTKIKDSYNTERVLWDNLLKKELVVLCCFCKTGSFCHRHLLAKFLMSLTTIEYGGEIPV